MNTHHVRRNEAGQVEHRVAIQAQVVFDQAGRNLLGPEKGQLVPKIQVFTDLHFAIWKAMIGQLLRSKT